MQSLLCLSIINSFLNKAGILQMFAWLNTCVYIFLNPGRFIDWIWENQWRERKKKWRRKCVQHISPDVCFHPSYSCVRDDVWEHFGHELWSSVNHSPPPTCRAKLSQTEYCPQSSNARVPFMWIFIREQGKIQVWTPKYLGQKCNSRALCGYPLWLYREVVIKLKHVCWIRS